jgi:hypothetical protein
MKHSFTLAKIILTTLLFVMFGLGNLTGQTTLFSESFDEANGATNGSSAEAMNWSASCPFCLAGDFYEVDNGEFKGGDTNGPARWQTAAISIPAGTQFIVLEMDFDATYGGGYAGSGNLESSDECTACGGTSADALSSACFNCWDFVALELDAGGGNITDDILLGFPGTPDQGNLCRAVDVTGSTQFVLSIDMSMWASTEAMSFDNVVIKAYTAAEATANNITAGSCPTCDLALGAATAVCNAGTFGGANTDAVTITIPFSGAGTGSETLSMGSFTNTGDDPSAVASGNIVFTATVGDAYSISLGNNICGAGSEIASGSVPTDLCPAACQISGLTVIPTCTNDGTTNYDLDISFSHDNPVSTAEVNISLSGAGSFAGFPDNNVSTTGTTQTESYSAVGLRSIHKLLRFFVLSMCYD